MERIKMKLGLLSTVALLLIPMSPAHGAAVNCTEFLSDLTWGQKIASWIGISPELRLRLLEGAANRQKDPYAWHSNTIGLAGQRLQNLGVLIRSQAKTDRKVIEIVPTATGSELNKYALLLKEKFGGSIIFDPMDLPKNGAFFDPEENKLALPFSSVISGKVNDSVVHEAVHMMFRNQQMQGKPSFFNMRFFGPVNPFADSSYFNDLSPEEILTIGTQMDALADEVNSLVNQKLIKPAEIRQVMRRVLLAESGGVNVTRALEYHLGYQTKIFQNEFKRGIFGLQENSTPMEFIFGEHGAHKTVMPFPAENLGNASFRRSREDLKIQVNTQLANVTRMNEQFATSLKQAIKLTMSIKQDEKSFAQNAPALAEALRGPLKITKYFSNLDEQAKSLKPAY